MMSEKKLSHVDASGRAAMVDVGSKPVTGRNAVAEAIVVFPDDVVAQLNANNWELKKGAVLETARIAGIMAVKKTSDLIPLCHPLPLEHIEIMLTPHRSTLKIKCSVSMHGKTGVEMEALTGASVAALTVYDMCKALSHDIEIQSLKLLSKTGGKNDFARS